MLLEAVEITTFLVEDRRIVYVSKFIRLDRIRHDAFAYHRFTAIHSEI